MPPKRFEPKFRSKTATYDADNDLYISYYKYSIFKRCPAQLDWYEQTKGGERPIADKRNAVIGSVIHTIFENYLKQTMTLMTAYGQIPKLVAAFEREQYVKWRGKNDRTEVIAKIAMQMAHVEAFIEKYDITPENTRSEVSLKCRYGPLKIAGRVDVLQAVKGGLRIFDMKATDRGREFVDPAQMMTYFLLTEGQLKVPVLSGTFLFTDSGKEWNVPRDPENEQKFLAELTAIARKIVEAKGELAFVSGKHCSWCDYKEICPFAARHLGEKEAAKIFPAKLIDINPRRLR